MTARKRAAALFSILAIVAALVVTIYWIRTIQSPVLAEMLWLPVAGGPGLAFGVFLDTLSVTMALVVCAVTLAVMVYSLGYMADDPGYVRYYLLLLFFAAAMLGLVLSSNLLQLLVFWELVGLASFLLIGFWFDQPGPAAAARKAFIMTRIGDVGFLLGVLLLIRAVGNANIPTLVAAAAQGAAPFAPRFTATVAALLLMGVIGKSAQGPLLTWLPDAMAGPTPVSALLHSATMVAAGVYLVARLHGLFAAAPAVMQVLLWMSLVTAVVAATMAMVAEDIKRVLAYSSISQLAYMLMALAAGSVAAGFFHLITHAGFKALLFLAAGIFIHHAHANDMRVIAQSRPTRLKAATLGLVTGGFALAGIVPFAGYFSKEAVLATLGEHAGAAAVIIAYIGAGLTAYYAGRMMFLTLRRDSRTAGRPSGQHARPAAGAWAASQWMAWPVVFLSALTLVLGWIGPWLQARLAPGQPIHRPLEMGAGALAALTLAVAGLSLAWLEYGVRGAQRVGFIERLPALRNFFADNWYLDRLYNATVVRAAGALSRLARWNDRAVLDGAGDGLAAGATRGGRLLARVQGGQVQAYVAVVVAVLVALALWLTRAEGLL